MAVSLVPLSCPKCGGQLQIPQGVREVQCSFCGTQITVDDGSQTLHVHKYDEAELKRLELEQEKLKQEQMEAQKLEEHRKLWRKALIIYIAAVFGLTAISSPLKDAVPALYGFLTTVVGLLALVGGVALYVQRPGKKKK